jgi:hypothetical protein
MWNGEPMEIPEKIKKISIEDTLRGEQAYFLSL